MKKSIKAYPKEKFHFIYRTEMIDYLVGLVTILVVIFLLLSWLFRK